MATRDDPDDPASGGNYDYRGDGVDRPGMVADLEGLIDGEVRFDDYSRALYATDASAYEVTPVGVVFPTSTADVVAVVEYCADRGVPVLPRGGGTSLAGQSVNEAVVLDFSRAMTEVCDLDPAARRVRAQAGVTLGDLNATLEPHGLKFAPDPAWGDKSVLGGAVGNNSTGSHSLKYGKTDAYVEEVEAVLADGSVVTLGETPLETIRAEADIGEVVSEIQQVRREVREVARYLKGVVEEMGGEVEYDEVRLGGPNIPEALEGEGGSMDNLQQRVNAAAEEVRSGEKSVEEALSEMDEEGGTYDPTEEFDG
jgi:hypothetical protein